MTIIMDDKAVVIITGASKGVGASVARWLGKTGTRLVVAARSKDGLLKSADEVEQCRSGHPFGFH